jgi:hypothetical protein
MIFFENPFLCALNADCDAYCARMANECQRPHLSVQQTPPGNDTHWDAAIIVYIARVPAFCKEPIEAVKEMLTQVNCDREVMIYINVQVHMLLELPVVVLCWTTGNAATFRSWTQGAMTTATTTTKNAVRLRIVNDGAQTVCNVCLEPVNDSNSFGCMLCKEQVCEHCLHHFMCNPCHHEHQNKCESCGSTKRKNCVCLTCDQWLCESCNKQHECYCHDTACAKFAWECYREKAYKFVRLLAS